MRVVIPVSGNPLSPRPSGIMAFSFGLAGYLKKRGHTVEFLCVGSATPDSAFQLTPVAARVRGEVGFALALRKFTRRHTLPENSIVLANSELHAWATRRWAPPAPLVLVSHGPSYPTLAARRPLIALLFRSIIEPRAARASRKIIAVDRDAERYFRDRYPTIPLQRIPLAIDLAHFAPVDHREARTLWGLSREIAFLFVGRLAPEKNPERAVEVFRRIRGSLPEAVLIVAGTGPLKGVLDKAAKELGPTRIRLLNDVPRADLPSLYSAADGLLVTSDIEQFPTVMLESLACGTPVFSTDVGDVSLVLSEPSMGLVCPANPELFAKRVAEYLPEERRLRASRAPLRRQATRKYDWDAIGPQIEAVLHEANG